MSQRDDGTDPVGELVDGMVDGMVTAWVLFVYYIDADTAEPCYFGDSMEGQGSIVTLGLAEAVAAIERERTVRHHFADDD